MSNIITATFCSEQTRAWTDELWQYDYGQILQFAGLELPNAYEVHFANQPHGVDSITQIGNADGVTIPDEFLLSGECVYAWVYLHTGVDDGETEYMVTIPVSKRAKPTHEEPTPVQQAEIEQAIAALNTAVNEAEDLADEWRGMTATAETLPEGSQATASYSEGTLTLGIPKGDTGKEGPQGIPGQDGSDGAPGAPGADGFSPEVSVTPITDGHEVTIKDAEGDHTFNVMNGEQGIPGKDGQPGAPGTDGNDGFSPQITVTDITGGHRITITDATGTKYVDVMDGEQGDPGPGVPAGGQDGDILRKNGNADFSSYWGRETVTDVKVDGTTILDADGVAVIPIAAWPNPGIVKVSGDYGITINANGVLVVASSTNNEIKTGTNQYKAVRISGQHISSFYGLAKAAGDVSQSASANAVGTYTEGAKSAISDMLNAPESKTGSTVSITAKSGIRYVCGECATLDIVVPASGLFEVDFESGSTATVLTTTGATVTWPAWFDPTDLEADTLYEISIQDGKGLVASWPA